LAYRATGGAAITGQVNLHTTSNYLVSGGFISGAISGNTSFVTTGNTGRLATHIISENGVSIGERVLVAGVKKTICEQIVLVSTGSKELGRYDSVTPDATWNAYKDSNGLGMLDRLKKFEFDCYYRDLNGDSIFDEAAGESAHFHMLMTIGF
jgi:hypothetical protein